MGRRNSKPPKTALLVAQRIVEDIHDQGKQPGDRLPPERDVLEQYEIGRGTLRESLRFLELQGVISLKPGPGGGPIVQKPDSSSLETTLTLQLQFDKAPYRAVAEARLGIEPLMASLSAIRMSAKQRAKLTENIEAMRTHLGDDEAFFANNRRFHSLIAEGSENALLGCTVDALLELLDGSALGVEYPEPRREGMLAAHTAIHDAIIAENAEGAEAAMRRHIDEYLRYLNKTHPEALELPIVWRQY